MENMEALMVVNILLNEFITRFGVPEVIHMDQGRNFEFASSKTSVPLLGVEKSRTSPYHPQLDGLVHCKSPFVILTIFICQEEFIYTCTIYM